jgi:hypothetical protein
LELWRTDAGSAPVNQEFDMAQKGAGGNPGAVTKKGGDGAGGSTGTGRGGGNNARGTKSASKGKSPDKGGKKG